MGDDGILGEGWGIGRLIGWVSWMGYKVERWYTSVTCINCIDGTVGGGGSEDRLSSGNGEPMNVECQLRGAERARGGTPHGF